MYRVCRISLPTMQATDPNGSPESTAHSRPKASNRAPLLPIAGHSDEEHCRPELPGGRKTVSGSNRGPLGNPFHCSVRPQIRAGRLWRHGILRGSHDRMTPRVNFIHSAATSWRDRTGSARPLKRPRNRGSPVHQGSGDECGSTLDGTTIWFTMWTACLMRMLEAPKYLPHRLALRTGDRSNSPLKWPQPQVRRLRLVAPQCIGRGTPQPPGPQRQQDQFANSTQRWTAQRAQRAASATPNSATNYGRRLHHRRPLSAVAAAALPTAPPGGSPASASPTALLPLPRMVNCSARSCEVERKSSVHAPCALCPAPGAASSTSRSRPRGCQSGAPA